MREFNLILPNDKGIGDALLMDLGAEMGLITPHHVFCALDLNKKDHGVYWMVEHFGAEMLARNQRTETALFGGTDPWVRELDGDRMLGVLRTVDQRFWRKPYQKNYLEDNAYGKRGWSLLRRLGEEVLSPGLRPEPFLTLIDRDSMLKHHVLVALSGSHHGELGFGNSKLYFSAEKGAMEPVPWDMDPRPLPPLQQSFDVYGGMPMIKEMLVKDPEYEMDRLKMIYRWIGEKSFMPDMRDRFMTRTGLKEESLSVVPHGTFLGAMLKDQLEVLGHNRRRILSILSHNALEVSLQIDPTGAIGKLKISSLMFSPVRVKGLKLGGQPLVLKDEKGQSIKGDLLLHSGRQRVSRKVAGGRRGGELLDALMPLREEMSFSFPWKTSYGSSMLTVEAVNEVTGEALGDDEIHVGRSSMEKPSREAQAANDGHGTMVIGPGEVEYAETKVFPRNRKTVIRPGTTLKLGADVSLVFQGPLEALGTEDQRIHIEASTGEFGVVAVCQGDNDRTQLKWLQISGGTEAWVGYRYFSGMLSVYGGEVDVNHCRFIEGRGEDALNVKFSPQFRLSDTVFVRNPSDGLDADFCSGRVEGCVFMHQQGDGADFSGGNFTILNNRFIGSGDKGLSIGEATVAEVTKNLFKGNHLGVAVKDQSRVGLYDNLFMEHEVAVAAYQKKENFGGAVVRSVANEFRGAKEVYFQDAHSVITESTREPDEGTVATSVETIPDWMLRKDW